jgi:hypothetical protein
MKLKNLTLEAINGGLDYAILVEKEPLFEYKNNKPVSNSPVGTKVTVVLPGNLLQRLTVKVKEVDALPNVTSEEIHEGLIKSTHHDVTFEGFIAYTYNVNGNEGVAATADSIELQ